MHAHKRRGVMGHAVRGMQHASFGENEGVNELVASEVEKENARKYGFIYCLPFLVLVFAYSVNLVRKHNTGIESGQFAFLSNPVNLIVLGLSYLSSAIFFCINLQWFFRNLKRNWLYLIVIFFVSLTVFVSNYPIKVLINCIHLIGMVLVVVSAVNYFAQNSSNFFDILSLVFLVIIFVSIFVSLFFPAIGTYQRLNSEWMGLTSNPNNLGDVAFVANWVAFFGLYFSTGKLIKFFNVLTISGAWICLFKADCITSLACSFIVLIAGPIFMSMEGNSRLKILLKIFFLSLFFIFIFLLLYTFFPEKLGIDPLFHSVGRDSTLSGRTSLWSKGLVSFSIKPILGWGFDSNASIMSKSIISYGQFHNGYLNVAVAGGSVGFVLLIIFIGRTILVCSRLRYKSFGVSVAFLALLMTLLLHDITEATFLNPTNLCWLMFVFSAFYIDMILWMRSFGQKSEMFC